MRGGLLAIGMVMMLSAVCFAYFGVAYGMRLDVRTSTPVPSESAPAQPVVELERKENVPLPEREKRIVPRNGARQAPSPAPEVAPVGGPPSLRPSAPPPEPAASSPNVVRASPLEEPKLKVKPPEQFTPEPAPVQEPRIAPAADTRTLVAVRTCDGTQIQLNAAEKKLYDLHNETRAKYGFGALCVGALCVSAGLTSAARGHSKDMLNRGYYSHDTPEGLNYAHRVKRLGFPIGESYGVGENIHMGSDINGYGVPETIFKDLMNSPRHRANILKEEYQEIGLGAVRGRYTNDDLGIDNLLMTAYTVDFGFRY